MKFLLLISLRNLLRQKRRNIMLGIAIAFGVMILVVAGSFSRGVSDIMFNKIVVNVAGHINVGSNEGRGKETSIFRDKERFVSIVKQHAGDYLIDHDEGLGVFLRALGNGKAENLILVGFDMYKQYTEKQMKEFDDSFHMLEGRYDDLKTAKVENAVIISKVKADSLNVRINDVIKVSFRNIYGQVQSARLTVVGILANDNIFMQGVIFIELKKLKSLMGYKPHESGSILLIIKDPEANARKVADKIHDALIPGPAFIAADASFRNRSVKATLLPFMGNEDDKKEIMQKNFTLLEGSFEKALAKDGVLISSSLSSRLNARVGDEIEYVFQPKFDQKKARFKARIKAVYKETNETGTSAVFMHENLFYPNFYENLPDLVKDRALAFIPAGSAPFKRALGNEWVLLPRSQTTDDMMKKMRDFAKMKLKAAAIDVNSMYESASDVLKLEGALNLITFVAVMILFFIILIGVINTLRMTIRERTREIGTIRAIGMQKKDVKRIFILETGFLTLFASIAGVIAAFVVMGLLSLITFEVSDNPMGILLVKQSLYFMPTVSGVAGNVILILVISLLTAYFPSRRAANLSAADALRHYE